MASTNVCMQEAVPAPTPMPAPQTPNGQPINIHINTAPTAAPSPIANDDKWWKSKKKVGLVVVGVIAVIVVVALAVGLTRKADSMKTDQTENLCNSDDADPAREHQFLQCQYWTNNTRTTVR